MRYETKSAIIGKKGSRDEEGNCPIFVNLFSSNNPHKTDKVPDKFLNFNKIHKIVVKNLSISWLLAGLDMLINDLEWIEVYLEDNEPGHLIIEGRQKL